MDKRYQVFVSSTFADLLEERQQLIQALLELECIPAGMEMFPAADDDQWTLIKSVIDDCDYYMVIIAGRYGSTHPETGVSYTEMEYDYAVESGKPVIGFIHAEPGKIELDKSEQNPKGLKRLEAFRQKVQGKMVQFWLNAHDLGGKVSRSLVKLIKQNPAEGWVRSRHVISVEEIANRDRRIKELESELRSVQEISPTAELELSEEATHLLQAAVKDKNGRILSIGTLQGWTVSSNGIEFLSEGTGEREAEWRGAVDQLSETGFIEDCGHKGEVFRVTDSGFKFEKTLPTYRGDAIDETAFELSDAARCYLMSISRPRNQSGIPVTFFDNSGSREAAHYRELLGELLEKEMLTEGTSVFAMTRIGYEVSDRLWQLYILRALSDLQVGQYDYIDAEVIAEQVVLTDGDSEEQELQRHLNGLTESGYVEPVVADGRIGGARPTPDAFAMIRNYANIELASVQ